MSRFGKKNSLVLLFITAFVCRN